MGTSVTSSLEVRIANEINRAVERFSAFEQRIVYTAISKIPVNDTVNPGDVFPVSAKELTELGSDAHAIYNQMIDAAKKLFDRQITLRDVVIAGRHWDAAMIRFASFASYNNETASIGISFAPQILPFISELQHEMTFFQLEDIKGFRSVYTLPLYRMLMQFMHEKSTGHTVKSKGWMQIEINELRTRLDVPVSYKLADFKRDVLDIAIRQINEAENTKFRVTYTLDDKSKIGKRFTKINFEMRRRQLKHPAEDAIIEAPRGLTAKQRRYIADVLGGKAKHEIVGKAFDAGAFLTKLYRKEIVPDGSFSGLDVQTAADKFFELLADPKFVDSVSPELAPWGIFL